MPQAAAQDQWEDVTPGPVKLAAAPSQGAPKTAQWQAYAKAGPYKTDLVPEEEQKFQGWVKQNKIPFENDSPTSDYDMRGYWKAQQSGDPNAKRAANRHFPDTYKTPYHDTFSNESKYALPTAGHWEGDKFVAPQPAKKSAPKSSDDWEDVTPQPKAAPVTPPATPGFFGTVAQDIGSMVKPLVGAGGVQLEDPAAFKKKFDAMTPEGQAAQRAQTRAAAAEMPTSDIASTESRNYQERVGAGQSVPRAVAETAYEASAGANMTGFDEAAKQGKTAEALGHLAAPVVLGAATHGVAKAAPHIPAVVEAVGNARGALGDYIHDPQTGELTPKIANTTRAAGSIVGGGLGYGAASVVDAPPYARAAAGAAGAGAGAVAAPSILESVFPESEARVGARDSFTKTKTITEAQESAQLENAKFDRAAAVKQKQLETAAQKAKDARDTAFTERGKSMQMQQDYQDKLDAAKTKADNALARSQREAQTRQGADMTAEIERNQELSKSATLAAEENRQRTAKAAQAEDARVKSLHREFEKSLKELETHRQKTLADREKLNNQWASALNRRGPVSLGADAETQTPSTHPNVPAEIGPSPQDLISRTRKIVVPGDEPSPEDLKRAGDFTQVPVEKLRTLAKWGDKLATNELNRRLQNEGWNTGSSRGVSAAAPLPEAPDSFNPPRVGPSIADSVLAEQEPQLEPVEVGASSKPNVAPSGPPAATWPSDVLRDRRAAPRVKAPDVNRTYRMQSLRGQLEDTTLPERDRAIIQSQLDDMVAHPDDETTAENLKWERPSKNKKMTWEEATAASDARHLPPPGAPSASSPAPGESKAINTSNVKSTPRPEAQEIGRRAKDVSDRIKAFKNRQQKP